MELFKDVTYEELLDISECLIEKFSTEKEYDLIQIKKFRQILKNQPSIQSLWVIEGWASGLCDRHNISVKEAKKYLRREKINRLNKK